MELTLRECVLLTKIFQSIRRGTGQTAASMMMDVQDLIAWKEGEVEAELEAMESDGLVERFDHPLSVEFWRATERGQAESEALFRRLGRRASCLCEPDESDLEDLVLALVATGSVCRQGHTYSLYESSVAYHLFDYRDGLDECLETLESRKHLRREKPIGVHGMGKHIRLLPNGLREYREAVAPRLGIEDGFCILDQQPRSTLGVDALVALGFDPKLVNILSDRMREGTACEDVEAYLAATAMYGSVLEGVLYGLAECDRKLANTSLKTPRDRSDKPKKLGDWKFAEYIAVGVDVGWIPKSVAGYVNQLRDARNLIHVKKQSDEGFNADKHLVRITKEVLYAVLEHVGELP